MVFHEAETLLVAEARPHLVGLEQAVWRGGLDAQPHFRTPHRKNRVAHRVPADDEVEGDVVGLAIGEAEQAAVVLVEVEVLVAEAGIDGEPVVWFVPTLSDGGRHAGDHEGLAQGVVLPFNALGLAVGLDGAPRGHRQGIGLFATQPRLGEAHVVALEEQAVGLRPDADPLAITHGHRTPRPLFERLADGEVVEGDPEGTHDSATTPTALQLDLVGGLLFHHIFDVDRAVFGILDGVDAKGFWVEVVELVEFALGPDHVRPAEQVPRHGADFAADDMVAGLGVAADIDPADAELLSLDEADFKVDAVVLGTDLYGDGLEGQIAIIAVQRAEVDALRVHEQPLLQLGDIVQISALEAQQAVQLPGGVLGVAGEGDLAQMELSAFLDTHGDAQISFWRSEQAVLHDAGVAVSLLPIVGHDAIHIGRELLFQILRRLENAPPGPLLDVAHLAFQGLGLHRFSARNADFAHLDLLALVDGDVHPRGILQDRVPRARHRHLGVVIPLVDVVVLQDAPGGDLEVFVDDLAPDEVELSPQRFLLATLDAAESVLGEAGHLLDANHEIDIVITALAQFDGHIAKQALVPEVAHGFTQPIARNQHLIADLQSAEQFDGLNIRVVCPEHGDASDPVFGGHLQVHRGRAGLGPRGATPQQGHAQESEGQVLHGAVLFSPVSAWRNWSPVRPKRRSRPRNS